MFKLIIIYFWNFYICIRCLVHHRYVFLVPPLVLVLCLKCWWLAGESSKALLPPQMPSAEQSLKHFKRDTSLQHYMSHIQVLIEPSFTPCGSVGEVPVIVMVTSAPYRFDQRQAARDTWAKYQPTYFAMGLYGHNVDENLVDNYIEAKQYSDLIVFDFRDHYQNLTLKTALMMKWSLDRCPQAQFMLKTDDDVFVNPWTLRKVIKENAKAQLVGYKRTNKFLYRRDCDKWYIPRWMFNENRLSEYLAGPGYLINGDYIKTILKKAYQVPIINMEDVYYTYLVAHKNLGLILTHDRRLSPYRPWLEIDCQYWSLASAHSFGADEMISAWSKITRLKDRYKNNTDTICSHLSFLN